MTAFDWIAIIAGSWLILATVSGVGIGRAIRAADQADEQPAYPPPLPAPTQADIDATWLDAWPTARPSNAEVRDLFDDIVRGQFDGRRTS